jgi:damage-control phosphatase, subfamily I
LKQHNWKNVNIELDCIPCFLRNALAAARLTTPDVAVHKQIMREALLFAAARDQKNSVPSMSQFIYRRLRELTGIADVYWDAKQRFNALALELLPELETKVSKAEDPFAYAVRLAIAGNVIDLGVYSDLQEADIRRSLQKVLTEPFCGDLHLFRTALSTADKILYLADNTGEIVFDRLLIEQLPAGHVTVAVRGGPVLNDALLTDAQTVGLDRIAEVIDNGSNAPGTILDDCSREFQDRFKHADVIIAKGQGNFETLCEASANIFFLLKIKCSVVSVQTGFPVGTQALIYHHS